MPSETREEYRARAEAAGYIVGDDGAWYPLQPVDKDADLAASVVQVLQSVTEEEQAIPHLVRLVSGYRAAARRIVEDERIPVPRKLVHLVKLAEVARGEDLGWWYVRAVWEELQPMVAPKWHGPPLSQRMASLSLRRSGYDRCPVCLTLTFTEEEVRLLEEREREMLDEARRWHEAGEHAKLTAPQPMR